MNAKDVDFFREIEDVDRRISVQERRLGLHDPDVVAARRDLEQLRERVAADVARLRALQARDASGDSRVH
jgi:hypothetical protein